MPLNDKATFSLLKSCETTAVFQLESRGFKELIRRLQPDHFDDIMALVALFRPGPLQSGMVDDFINRKHGRAKVEYLHPLLAPILRPTYGVIVYQEQVMKIAQVMAGYTLGGADLLRRAMGKKKVEEMAKQREIFVTGAHQHGVHADMANQIFDLMEMFADYGFNKSHSAAYALLSYQTAWLKSHYPGEFMAAVLSSDMDNTDKVVKFLEECQKLDLSVAAPDINLSQHHFTVNDSGDLIYGLGAIKGVGSTAVENILQCRQSTGRFSDLFEFCYQVDTSKVNRKVLEALIRSGAMDCFQVPRSHLMSSIDVAVHAAEQLNQTEALGQMDLFSEDFLSGSAKPSYIISPAWSDEQRLAGEKETLGWYVSGHPIAHYEDELSKFITAPICGLKPARDKTVVVAGYVMSVRTMQTKSGGRIAFLTLDDRSGRIELAVFSQLYESCRELLVKDQLLIVEGEVGVDEFTENHKLTGRQVYDLTQAREKFAKGVSLTLHKEQLEPSFIQRLQQALKPFCGGQCPLYIHYQQENAQASLALGDEWCVKPSASLLEVLAGFSGQENVRVEYGTLI